MKSLKQYKTWAIILSVLMMVLGIVMMIWPNVSAMAVCCLMGAICIATGVYELIRYFDLGVVGVLFRHDLLISILSIITGIVFLCHPLGALTILPIILGFYIIIAGVFSIQISTESRSFGISNWWKSLSWNYWNYIWPVNGYKSICRSKCSDGVRRSCTIADRNRKPVCFPLHL